MDDYFPGRSHTVSHALVSTLHLREVRVLPFEIRVCQVILLLLLLGLLLLLLLPVPVPGSVVP